LHLRKPIYKEVFDKKWVKDHLPVNRAKRLQRTAVALIITLLILSFPPALYAWNRAVVAEKRVKKLYGSSRSPSNNARKRSA
jgi:hypothetical protein